MSILRNLFYIVTAITLTACGNKEEFTVNCEIEGLGSRGVEMVYCNRNIRKVPGHPSDGKVTFKGDSPDPTLIEVFTLDHEPLFSAVACNGETLNVKMKLDNPRSITIKGNDTSRDMADFVRANDSIIASGDIAAVNRLVAAQIASHPDRISSTALLITRFHAPGYEILADSLLNLITPDARPVSLVQNFSTVTAEQIMSSARGDVKPMTLWCGRDTIAKFFPSYQSYGLLVFVSGRKNDSITSRLHALGDSADKRRLAILEISLDRDSATWRRSIEKDSATWMQAWTPGGAAGPSIRSLAIPRTPFFIVTDSTSHQIYRGSSITQAVKKIKYNR